MYYVSMTDKFMSGWGHARNLINKLVISCETYDQACVVATNAADRNEMKYINIRVKKPYYGSDYLVSRHGKTEHDYQTWFSTERPFKR